MRISTHLNRLKAPSLSVIALGLTLGAGWAVDSTKPVEPAPVPQARTTSKPEMAAAEADATYLRDVLPIIMGRCSRCHNGQSVLPNWLDYKTAYAHRQEIKRRVWDSWKGTYYKQPMPAGNSQECQSIGDDERLTIKHWVAEGGTYGVPSSDSHPRSKEERIQKGQKLFATICAACHQATGQGLADKFPPLAGSDFLNADKNRAIRILLNGRQGEIVVNQHKFNGSMPSLPLGDDDIASALTYVYNSFGNSGKVVTPEEVHTLRGKPDADAPGQQTEVAHQVEQASPFE